MLTSVVKIHAMQQPCAKTALEATLADVQRVWPAILSFILDVSILVPSYRISMKFIRVIFYLV